MKEEICEDCDLIKKCKEIAFYKCSECGINLCYNHVKILLEEIYCSYCLKKKEEDSIILSLFS